MASLGLFAVSCKESSEPYSYKSTVSVQAYNLFTSATDDEEPVVGTAVYSLTMTYPDPKISVSSSKMIVPGNTQIDFSVSDMSMTTDNYQWNGIVRQTISFNGNNSSLPAITDFRGCISNAVNYHPDFPKQESVPGYSWKTPSTGVNGLYSYVFLQYDYDKWNVRTFWNDMTYSGLTITSYLSGDETISFNNENVYYRVIMKGTGADLNKADILIYDAKFAEPMPQMTLVLKGLDLEFTNDGYTISGQNIVAEMKGDGGLVPFPAFPFTSFKAVFNGKLTGMNASYTVENKASGAVYTGLFNGSCFLNVNM